MKRVIIIDCADTVLRDTLLTAVVNSLSCEYDDGAVHSERDYYGDGNVFSDFIRGGGEKLVISGSYESNQNLEELMYVAVGAGIDLAHILYVYIPTPGRCCRTVGRLDRMQIANPTNPELCL